VAGVEPPNQTLHLTLIHAWKKQLLAGAEQVFAGGAKAAGPQLPVPGLPPEERGLADPELAADVLDRQPGLGLTEGEGDLLLGELRLLRPGSAPLRSEPDRIKTRNIEGPESGGQVTDPVDLQVAGGAVSDLSYQSAPRVSPPAGVTAAQKVASDIAGDTDRTLPSPIATMSRPGWGDWGMLGLHSDIGGLT